VIERLRSAPLVAAAAEAMMAQQAWIVGGAVRDAALGEEVRDLDLAVPGDPGAAARALAGPLGGHAFELSSEFRTWRVVVNARGWQVDLTPLREGSIDADLAARDFTIGAVAVPLGGGEEEVRDPYDGLGDLQRRVLRAVGERSFVEEPLRLLRAPRLAAGLGLELDPDTAELARDAAPLAADPAGERQLAELRQLLGGPDPLRGLRLMDELAVTPVVLPEVAGLRGVGQGPNHHLDVHDHTLAVLEHTLEIEADLERFAGERADEVAALLAEPLADEMSRGTALRFGALFHDIAKPQTRQERDGFVGFRGHDALGAELIEEIFAGRLRASRRLTRHLQALALHHLRLGFMLPERPLGARRVHDYLRATEPVTVDVTLLTVADRLSARGAGPLASPEMVSAHLELARDLIAAALDWRRDGPPEPLLRGEEVAAALDLEPGPELGEAIAELEAAQYAGEVGDRESALAHLTRNRL
jgi:putative nucleotidyltransferase with HDIG domain